MLFIPTLAALATLATLTSATSVWINCVNDPAYDISSVKSSSLKCDSFCFNYAYVYWSAGDGACRCSNTPTPIQGMVGSGNAGGTNSCPSTEFNEAKVSSNFGSFFLCLSATNKIVAPYVQNGVATVADCWNICLAQPGPPGYASYKASTGQLQCMCFSSFSNTPTGTNCGSGDTYVWQYGPNNPASGLPDRRRQLAANQQAALVADQHPYCPPGLSACRVNGVHGLGPDAGYECINPQAEIESCGGCLHGTMADVSNVTGVDCTTLPGVMKTAVTCHRGHCRVWKCERGYNLVDGACVPK